MAPRTLNSGHFKNLNAVRLMLALLVVLSHSVVLCWGTNDREFLFRGTNGYESFGAIAVDGFFLISGMLITASWFRCGSLRVFLYRRILRIYPAFIVALLFGAGVAFGFSPAFRLQVHGISYAWSLVRDTLLLGTSTASHPATFQHNPLAGVVNGSLWTINQEFRCYLLVALLGVFAFLDRRKSVLFAAVLFWVLYARDILQSHQPWLSDFRLLCFFVVGMVAWLFRDKLILSARGAAVAATILLATLRFSPWFSLALPLAGSYLLLWIGTGPAWKGWQWTNQSDFSYGVYLYAFPIQQIAASYPGLRSPVWNLALAIPLTMGCAALSWHLVEKRFLALKDGLRREQKPMVAKVQETTLAAELTSEREQPIPVES